MWPPLRPVAPLHAVRASSRSTFGGDGRERRLYAMKAPVIPEPIMRMSADAGSVDVVRCVDNGDGRSCQYDTVGLSLGSPGGMEARCSIVRC